MIYTVQTTERAENKLKELRRYIAEVLLSPDAANNQVARLLEKIASLEIFPKRYRIYNSTISPGKDIRRMLVDNYSILYYIDNDIVFVADIIYSRADIVARLQGK